MQLFSWRIGQALAYAGARIVSTNTDGLYSVLESELNNKILAHEAESINVQIDPEPMYLISKDTNNRIEMDPETGNVVGASGGSLACRKGPSVTKSLTHPAAIDWALTEYLIVAALHYKNLSLSSDFDDTTGMNILQSMSAKFDKVHLLRMFQNVIASSIGSINYVFGTTDDKPGQPIVLQHYNRVFIMKDGTPDTMHLHAANARVITAAQQKKRSKDNERAQQHDPVAVQVLSANGVTLSSLPSNKEAVVKKVTNIEDTWYMYVCNADLHYLSDDQMNFILNNLDYDKYLTLLRDGYENNWRNHMPADYIDPATINVDDTTIDDDTPVDTDTAGDSPENNDVTDETTSVSSETTVDNAPAQLLEASVETTPEPIVSQEPTCETIQESIVLQTPKIDDNAAQAPVAEPTTQSAPAEAVPDDNCAAQSVETKSEPKSEPSETKSDEISSTNSISIMSLLDNTDIQRIVDTSKVVLTGLNEKRATFVFRTEDPELVERLCKLLY